MAMISQEKINEIKVNNDIVDVISSYISVNDKYQAVCPFHSDHSPSLSIHPEKQIYKCWACGESGNVITFVEKYLGISFIEAIKLLADRAGIPLDISTQKKNTVFDKYYEINDTVLKFYKNNLISNDGKEAIKYLNDRGLTKELINEFNIGLSTSNKLNTILDKKYQMQDLIDIDIAKTINGKIYDTFQNRIIFPIIDENNNIVAFSGRKYLESDVKDNTISKYVNSKETKIFKKSGLFYNINNALPNIKKNREIVICEGFMDTIRMSSIGYKNVVALMGTAFTSDHLDKILKYKCKVILNLDQDNAGKTATISIGEELLKNNVEVSVIVFDDYKDSDEYIVHKGKDAFDVSYKNRISFIDFKLNYLKLNKNMNDSVSISKYINEAIESLNKIDDEILRELKVKELSDEFKIDISVIKNKLKPIKENKDSRKTEIITEKKKYNKYDISEIRLLYLMLNYDDVILYFENTLGYMIDEKRSSLAYKIIEFKSENGEFNYNDFIDYINGDNSLEMTLKEVNLYPNKEEYSSDELDDYINTIKEYSVKERIKALQNEMKSTLDINKKIEIAKKIENIKKEVSKW